MPEGTTRRNFLTTGIVENLLEDPDVKITCALDRPHYFSTYINHPRIEFIQFKRWLENLYADATLKLDYKSCEMMADELNSIIQQRYEGRGTIIEVSEDGENGCTIMFPPKGKKTEFATYQEMMSSTNPSASAGEQ